MYKGIIFDLDGTLVNSLEDIADSMNKVLSIKGFTTHTIENYKLFIGKGIRNLVLNSLPKTNISKSIVDECYTLMMHEYSKNCVNKTFAYDGIENLLIQLNKRKIKLAVFSNKTNEFTNKIVNQLFASIKFEQVIGFSTEELRKPNPFIVNEICDIFNLEKQNILYVGDSEIDMQTASNAGLDSCGVCWGFKDKTTLLDSGAKYLIEKPEDLLTII